jgi:glycosyltransferase involved in cell wall biosynthesis
LHILTVYGIINYMELARQYVEPKDIKSPDVHLLRLRDLNPAEIVRDYSAFTRDRFSSPDGFPVLIPAFNEEVDLPATLLALARSNIDIKPIVIDNASTDSTAEYATAMGAITIHENVPGKMKATQTGLEQARAMGYKRILFTDADTLPGKKWAVSMHELAGRIDPTQGGLVAGTGLFDHGPNLTTDILRSANSYARATMRRVQGKYPMTQGYNYLLALDMDGVVAEGINDLAPNLFPGEDFAIRDKVIEGGGHIVWATGPDTLVFTRNDRFRSLGEGIMTRLGFKQREELYQDQYGNLDFVRYDSPLK